MALHTVW